MPTTITPAATLHTSINIPSNNVDLADAAWMALYTWRELGDNAKYALDQIDTKIAAMKADNALTFSGTTVTVTNELAVGTVLNAANIAPTGGNLSLNADVALVGTARKLSGGRRVEPIVTLSDWSGDPAENYHLITGGNVVRVVTSIAAHLRLQTTGCVTGDWVRVTLADGVSVAVYNASDSVALATLDTEGQQMTFSYIEASGWVIG